MAKVVLPKLNQVGANEWADVEDNDVALREGVNSINNEQIASEAGITDAKLASPNNSAYRTLLSAQQFFANDQFAGTYPMQRTPGGDPTFLPAQSGASTTFFWRQLPFFYFDDADYTVAGKTQKLRLRAQIMCNATKATIKFTFGLYPITCAGAADTLSVTLGTVVSGSTVEINEPAASTISSGVGADFAVPADGAYVLGVVTSAELTNNSYVLTSAQLQTHSV